MVQFLCMFFPAVISLLITYSFRKENFSTQRLIVSYSTFTLVINSFIFLILTIFFNYQTIVISASHFTTGFALKYLGLSVLLAILTAIIFELLRDSFAMSLTITPSAKEEKRTRAKTITRYTLSGLFLFLSFILYFGSNWMSKTFGLLSPDSIIFHLKVPLDGSSNDFVYDFIKGPLIYSLLLLALAFLFIWNPLRRHLTFTISLLKKSKTFVLFRFSLMKKYFLYLFRFTVN